MVRELAMDRPASTSPASQDGLERPVVIDPIDPMRDSFILNRCVV
jgi:hypothetical protein